MNHIETITVQRLSLWTVTKLFFLGTSISFALALAPLFAAAVFGVGPIAHGDHPVTGIEAVVLLLFMPLIAPFAAFLCGVGHWALLSTGLWIYSLWMPVQITFRSGTD